MVLNCLHYYCRVIKSSRGQLEDDCVIERESRPVERRRGTRCQCSRGDRRSRGQGGGSERPLSAGRLEGEREREDIKWEKDF